MARQQTKAANIKGAVEIDHRPVLVRTARPTTGAYVIGDADQAPPNERQLQMGGNDMLYLLVAITLDASSTLTEIRLMLEFSHDGGTTWFSESGLSLGAMAAGDLPVDVGRTEYRFFIDPAGGVLTRNYRLALPVDDPMVRVSVSDDGVGAADPADLVGVTVIRTIRDSVVP